MSDDKLELKIKGVCSEYLDSNNSKEAYENLSEALGKNLGVRPLQKILDHCVNVSVPNRARISSLVLVIFGQKLLAGADVETATLAAVAMAMDNEYDAPGYCKFLGDLIGQCVGAGAMGCKGFFEKLYADDGLVDGGKAGLMAVDCLAAIKAKGGSEAAVKAAVDAAGGLDFGKLVTKFSPPDTDEKLTAYLAETGLQFLQPASAQPASASAQKYLTDAVAAGTPTEGIVAWMADVANVSKEGRKDPELTRAVVAICLAKVCEASLACTSTDKKSDEFKAMVKTEAGLFEKLLAPVLVSGVRLVCHPVTI